MVDCPDRRCPACKGPMPEGKKSACSGACRATLSRQKKAHRLMEAVARLAREVGLKVEDLE